MIRRDNNVRLRLPLVLIAAVATAALTGCGVHGLHMAQSPLLKIFVARSGHIAYVGNNGNIFVADQSGSATALTSDAGDNHGTHTTYVAPTWAPDGERIAYARYATNPANGRSRAQLDVLDWKTKALVVTFQSSRLKPFYFDWSPDGSHIAVLSDVGGGKLELGVVSSKHAGSYAKIDEGSPYYWTWAEGGSHLISHTDFTSSNGGMVSVIPLADPAKAVKLDESFGLFQAPSVLPNGDIIAVEQIGTTSRLTKIDPKTETSTPFAPFSSGGFIFSVSPNGKMIAYVEDESVNGQPSAILRIWDFAEHKVVRTVEGTSTVGFYWSPDSSKIAYYVPASATAKTDSAYAQVGSLPRVTLRVLDVGSGDSWQIATFPLTQGLLSTLPYTDQYQHSQTIWSPNSKFLLFSAYTKQNVPGVFVANADGNIKPSVVANGDSAVWSWK